MELTKEQQLSCISKEMLDEAITGVLWLHPERDFTHLELAIKIMEYHGLSSKDLDVVSENSFKNFRYRLNNSIKKKQESGLISIRRNGREGIGRVRLFSLNKNKKTCLECLWAAPMPMAQQ